MNSDIIYAAVVYEGEYSEYHETIVFCSFVKEKVQVYVDRFNRLMEKQRKKAKHMVEYEQFNVNPIFHNKNEQFPLWYWDLDRKAKIIKLKFR